MRKGLSDTLKLYGESDFYPFHMPGHKRNLKDGIFREVLCYDITEIDGFDNLHQPEFLIREAQERAAKLYHSKEAYFLVNGSTAGILSAVSAAAEYGKKLIIARNCHKAVYNAAFLNRMQLYYVYPKVIEDYGMAGEVMADDLEEIIRKVLREEPEMEKGGIAGIVITSPTYDGIVSDVLELSETAHRYGIPLIVDQAHGAHFGLHPAYPENAVKEGADIVIHSVHKTLSAPTQTALLHRNSERIEGEILKKYLRIYQSSSPSYLLMAGIDDAVFQAEREGYERLEKVFSWRCEFLEKIKNCMYIRVCQVTEPGKLIISAGSSVTGQKLYDVLRDEYHLQMEMAAGSYVTAILTMMDEKEGIDRLLCALLEIDRKLSEGGISAVYERAISAVLFRPKVVMGIWDAYRSPYHELSLKEAVGRGSAEFVNLYPPGIPLLVPGEELDGQVAAVIMAYLEKGYTLHGICKNKIKVIKLQNEE